jgi:hypothetical protein
MNVIKEFTHNRKSMQLQEKGNIATTGRVPSISTTGSSILGTSDTPSDAVKNGLEYREYLKIERQRIVVELRVTVRRRVKARNGSLTRIAVLATGKRLAVSVLKI